MRYPKIRQTIKNKKIVLFFLSVIGLLCLLLSQIKSSINIETTMQIIKSEINNVEDAQFNLLGTNIDLLETQLTDENCNEGYLEIFFFNFFFKYSRQYVPKLVRLFPLYWVYTLGPLQLVPAAEVQLKVKEAPSDIPSIGGSAATVLV